MEHKGIEYFQNKGRELGYKDEELRSYVKEQCDIERDERERERQANKEARESEERRRNKEIEHEQKKGSMIRKPENLKKDEEIKR